MTSENTGFPSLQPAFVFKVNVGEGNAIGDLSNGSSFHHFQTPTGTMKSVPSFKPELDAQIVFGADWLYFDPDKAHARLNFKGVAKHKDGTPFTFYYTGTITINEEVGKIFAFSPESKTTAFGASTTIHSFETGSPELKDLENCHWVGNGRFIVGTEGLTVESRVSKVIPSTVID